MDHAPRVACRDTPPRPYSCRGDRLVQCEQPGCSSGHMQRHMPDAPSGGLQQRAPIREAVLRMCRLGYSAPDDDHVVDRWRRDRDGDRIRNPVAAGRMSADGGIGWGRPGLCGSRPGSEDRPSR